jgi:RNA polymerase sigma factor (sigma-70 family)
MSFNPTANPGAFKSPDRRNTGRQEPLRHMADPVLIDAYMRKRDALVRFFSVRTRSAERAEDLVQDLFIKLQAMDAPDDLQNPEAFLYRMGANLMLDRVKQERRETVRDSRWSLETIGSAADPIAPEPEAEAALDSRRRLQKLMAAVERLPPQVATAFRLHKFDGLSHGEVAQRMGVSRSSVEKYIMTALRTLLLEVGR